MLRRLVPTRRSRDHTVKVRVGGLKPDRRYFYRFSTRTTTSDVGRTQTAPARDSRRPLRVGYFACQSFTTGYFGAYQALLQQDPDFVICGGDYIYDRVYSGYGGAAHRRDRRQPRLGRGHARRLPREVPPVPHRRGPARAAPARPARPPVGRPRGHRQLRRDAPRRPDRHAGRRRRARHLRPRRASAPAGRPGTSTCPHGASARASAPTARCASGARSSSSCATRAPTATTSRAAAATSSVRRRRAARVPRRQQQLGWLKDGPRAQPVDLEADRQPADGHAVRGLRRRARSRSTPGRAIRAQRGELLGHLEQRGIEDVVFVTGDIHTFFAGSVLRDGKSGPAVASELVGGSTTSPGTAEVLGETAGGISARADRAADRHRHPAGEPVDRLRRHPHARMRAARARPGRGPRALPRLAGHHDARRLARRPRHRRPAHRPRHAGRERRSTQLNACT